MGRPDVLEEVGNRLVLAVHTVLVPESGCGGRMAEPVHHGAQWGAACRGEGGVGVS